MKIKLILFDFFGTLAFLSKRPDPLKFLGILEKFGCDFNNLNWKKGEESLSSLNDFFCKARNWEDSVRLIFKRFGKRPSRKAIQEITSFLKKNLVFKFYKDFAFIKELPFRKALLTSAPKFIFSNITLGGFEKILTPLEVRAIKPDLKAFLSALKIFKIKPEEILMVGDDLEGDIIPAGKIGMEAVLIDRNNSIKIKNSSVKKINSLKELKNILI
ncbi:HAD hydrolase-like protein [Patescibacteria group bacterium]|nr:HAD hydrolase-like protein [Patescibacteria group bacterium]